MSVSETSGRITVSGSPGTQAGLDGADHALFEDLAWPCDGGYVTAVSGGQGADLFRQQSAVARYGVSGKGVVIAILDRGIEWQNPDFRKPNGTTQIKWLLDMSGQTNCRDPRNPRPVEYSEAQINAALAGGPALESRDAVGHGTLTAGISTGNGRACANGAHRRRPRGRPDHRSRCCLTARPHMTVGRPRSSSRATRLKHSTG